MTGINVAKLLENPKRWCVGANAYDRSGNDVPPNSDIACRWCVVGAIQRVYGFGTEAWRARQKLRAVIGVFCINGWNDAQGRTHTQIIAAVREAGI